MKVNTNKIAQGDVSIFSHLTFVASRQFLAMKYLVTPAPIKDTVPNSSGGRLPA